MEYPTTYFYLLGIHTSLTKEMQLTRNKISSQVKYYIRMSHDGKAGCATV